MTADVGFIAYPGTPSELSSVIREATNLANAEAGPVSYETWEHNDIAGKPLTTPILSGIESAQLLVADVTRLNFNVTYEIGYAIGIKKRVLLIRNSTITSDDTVVLKVGIFDTLGHERYSNSEELSQILRRPIDFSPLKTDAELDKRAPVYLLECPVRTPEMVRIVARVKKARLFYRSFTPAEESRLSAIDAIHHVARSMGVLVPLLSPEFEGSEIHNIRAAFLAGLAHGMSKKTLVLYNGRHPVPLDLRDSAETYINMDDINRHIESFAGDIYEEMQKTDVLEGTMGSLLQQVSLGDPMAENEFQTLSAYYVQTDEFARTLRGEVNLVVGRKGTGKTALFFQVRDRIRKDRQNVVIDLKPEGYQLLKLKEQVLDYLSEGAKLHLITAFWEYLLLLEICRKILEKDQQRHRYDHSLSDKYENLATLYHSERNAGEGDFSERLLILSDELIEMYQNKYGIAHGKRLTTDEVTGLLHATTISELKFALNDYLGHKEQVLVLFDNLDKGWSYRGIESGDIVILRCLIDASRKVQREMRKIGIQISCVIFIRNDIYQLLVQGSSDFGKETRASLDWSDPDLLREVLRRRLVQQLSKDITFDQIWGKLCTSHFDGEETSQYLIDRSLMRPRNLLKLVGYCKGFAVNLDHERIEVADIQKGLRSYSNDLVLEADRELTDVEPTAEGLIYEFVGEPPEMSKEDICLLLEVHGIEKDHHAHVLEFLLYFGFLGIRVGNEDAKYVFDFGYDMGILNAVLRKNLERVRFVLNTAFWPALEVKAVVH